MHTPRFTALVISGFALTLLPPHQAHAQSNTPPDELQAIFACKGLTNPQERLACYDGSVERFEAAQESGEVVTVSKTAIEKVERDAFGFNIPSLPSLGNLFGGGDKEKRSVKDNTKKNDLTDPVTEASAKPATPPTAQSSTILSTPKVSDINTVTLNIKKTTEFGYKKTRFFMSNGQVWEQADSLKVRIPKVRNGKANTAKISKAALGSFLLRVNGKGKAIRVRRVR